MPDPTPWAEAEATVRRLANQRKNKPLLTAFGHLLHAVRHGLPGAMTVAESAFWVALEERDRALLAAITEET